MYPAKPTDSGPDGRARTVPALFSHPDGPTIAHSDNTLICIGEDDSTVFIPIGHIGLKSLAFKLLALSAELEGGAAQ